MNFGGKQNLERGTALLISMVLVAVVGTIAFAIGRVSLSSFTQVIRLEDSLNAYSAATSGIEDGLLRFRYNKDIQTPSNCGQEQYPTTTTNNYTRVNLTRNESQNCVNPEVAGPPPNPTDVAYDIKISHKLDVGVSELRKTEQPRGIDVPALKKDQAIEYDVSDIAGTIGIDWTYSSRHIDNNVEISLLGIDGAVLDKKLINGRNQLDGSFPSLSVGNADIVRIRPFGSDLFQYEITSSESLSSRTTTIEVIGYYGRSKRKLELTLDRISGSILELFDFVLFSGSGDVSGPDTN